MANLYSPKAPKSKPAVPVDSIARLLALLSPIQQQYVLDPSRNKVARCPRRAGKSYAGAGSMLYTALKDPKSPVAYFGLTRDSAKEAIWQTLKDLIDEAAIECVISDAQLTVTLPNGSEIRLFGLDMANLANRFRGRKYKKGLVDECAFYSAVDGFITTVFSATLMDLQGSLEMLSSPGLVKRGLFYEADQGKQKDLWARYTWTLADNPHFQQPSLNPKFATLGEEELDRICVMRFGGDRTHPGFRREYLGEWVFDEHALVYPLKAEYVLAEEYPLTKQEYAIGLNLSQHGHQGYVVAKFSDYSRSLQVVEAEKLKCKNLNVLCETLKELQETYDTDRVYVYLGDEHPEIIDDFKQRYKIPLQASRFDKVPFYQQIISTDMDSGYVEVIAHCTDLIDEFSSAVKDDAGNELDSGGSLLSDAFFALYLNLYNSVLKGVEPEETADERMERQVLEEFHEHGDQYRDDAY